MLVSATSRSKSTDPDQLLSLAARLGARLTSKQASIATAESCTGGWIAKCITDIPGSSNWFKGGIVSYANSAKRDLLDVPDRELRIHGAVSSEVVTLMALGAKSRLNADCSIAVSGVAGPSGGTFKNPVGTVWFAWIKPDGRTMVERQYFRGDRNQVRFSTVHRALQALIDDD